jgi:hypothetical protein
MSEGRMRGEISLKLEGESSKDQTAAFLSAWDFEL